MSPGSAGPSSGLMTTGSGWSERNHSTLTCMNGMSSAPTIATTAAKRFPFSGFSVELRTRK